MVGLRKIFTQSVADFLEEWFESEEVKVTLATDGGNRRERRPDSAGTAYILMHHCMGGVNGKRGLWGFVKGGMSGISESISASARSAGAVIRTSSTVKQILIRDGKARGVLLENGEEISASIVSQRPRSSPDVLPPDGPARSGCRISRPDQKFPLRRHVPQDEFRPERPAKLKALPGTPGRSIAATIHICPTIDYVERAWNDAEERDTLR